ncbi:hypothetical protein [Streptomyces sp. NPDC057545]|uniref:hypothetical protein n=1 Tax=Streptomyces sp. NPDC057545 TaxID=3346164 RepID=UPI0036772396
MGGEDGVQAVVEGRVAVAVAEEHVAEGFVLGDEGFLFGDCVAGDVVFGDAAECGEGFPLGAGGAVGPVGEVGGEGVGDEDAVVAGYDGGPFLERGDPVDLVVGDGAVGQLAEGRGSDPPPWP